ncbi:glycosyltransferase family 4 protein [Cupriavidus plantarum]|uniref:glycosyltransferase family 4 protein n=1 Tax=Cupriavidus plantarum TaxID=942865 RepID=UPI0015CCC531|nr:glycosyltransferase family 4 protein [Cupriavidus plantarum]NYH98076.1 glycosyltransferase involved in cell wall biosynthesis [Cupriavidus plantarum]
MTARPTVCFLTGSLNAFAGAERMTAVIASGLAERGYRVFVLSLYDPTSVFPLHEHVMHHALFDVRPSFKRAYLATVLGIRRFLREHGVDVLIEVDTMLTLFTVPATIGMSVRRVAWEHCHFDEDLGRPVRRLARRLAARTNAAVVVLTERDRQRWLTAIAGARRVAVIHNALPLAFPTEPAPRDRLDQHDRRVLLAVGRLTHAKGFDTLLRAWAQARPSLPGWKLQIIGDGEAREPLQQLIDSLGLACDSSAMLVGATAEVGAAYRNAAAFCLSSRYEGFGLVLIEAMAYGLPIVATRCETGPKDLLEDGANAVLVPVDDDVAMSRALVRVCTDAALQERLATNGRAFATQFELPRVLERWTGLLDGLAQAANAR